MKIIRTSTISLSLNVLLKGQLGYLSQYFEIIGISSNGNDLSSVEEREKIKTIAVDMERGISPLKDLISLIILYKVFKKQKPKIVHSITPKAGLLSMLAGKMAGIPIRMHTFTGLIFPTRTGLTQRLLIKMDQLLCWAATNIYPEGNGVKQDLIKYKITSKPLKVIANGNINGIDLDYFCNDQISEDIKQDFKRDLNISENDFVFVFVGRLVGDKGINELVEAFKVMNTTLSGSRRVKLLLVGPLETKLDPLSAVTLEEIVSNSDIISVGFQKDVRPYFAISHALVFPSYREGFPNVVIQAGAMGLPSVVSNINGCNEIIIDGQNGIIIPPRNFDAIRLAMLKLTKDGKYFNSLKANAREMIAKRYEQQVVWEALLNEYNQLLRK